MCRDTISVGWDGRLYDCDFNQQLEMTMTGGSSDSASPASAPGPARGLNVFDVVNLAELTGRPIKVDNHCFGCTAGAGSSCTGAVA